MQRNPHDTRADKLEAKLVRKDTHLETLARLIESGLERAHLDRQYLIEAVEVDLRLIAKDVDPHAVFELLNEYP